MRQSLTRGSVVVPEFSLSLSGARVGYLLHQLALLSFTHFLDYVNTADESLPVKEHGKRWPVLQAFSQPQANALVLQNVKARILDALGIQNLYHLPTETATGSAGLPFASRKTSEEPIRLLIRASRPTPRAERSSPSSAISFAMSDLQQAPQQRRAAGTLANR